MIFLKFIITKLLVIQKKLHKNILATPNQGLKKNDMQGCYHKHNLIKSLVLIEHLHLDIVWLGIDPTRTLKGHTCQKNWTMCSKCEH